MSIKNHGNNIIESPNNDNINIIVVGENNVIKIPDTMPSDTKLEIKVYGNNNKITMGNIYGRLRLTMGYEDGRTINDAEFKCGNGRMNDVYILMIENKTKVLIGEAFRFSSSVHLRCTDDHAILDQDNKVINKADSIIIGDRVWLGMGCTILKNSIIPDECVVGYNSVVAKKFFDSNSVIVGNPARIVKRNIKLDILRPDLYEERFANNQVQENQSPIGPQKYETPVPQEKHSEKKKIKHRTVYKIFGKIPIFSKSQTINTTRYYLFNFIEILKKTNK